MIKVLIADDSKTVRMVLRRMIEKLRPDYALAEAKDLPSIMDTYFRFEPDLIMLDLEFPEASGWEVLQNIRKWDTKTRIVMVTGHREEENVLDAIKYEADGFVGKPFDFDEVAQILEVAPRKNEEWAS